MDKNQLTGLVLMLALLTVYFLFLSPDPEIPTGDDIIAVDTTSRTTQDSTKLIPQAASIENISDSAKAEINKLKYGIFSNVSDGVEKKTTLENNQLVVDFSNKGGVIENVFLKEYTAYDGSPLTLLVDQRSQIDIAFGYDQRNLKTSDLYFESEIKNYGDSTQLIYSITTLTGEKLFQVYTLKTGSYEIGYELKSEGFEKVISPQNLTYSWNHSMNRVEPDIKEPRNQRSTVRYYTKDGEVDFLSTTDTHDEEKIETSLGWVAFKQKYFTSAIVAENSFASGFVTSDIDEASEIEVKATSATLEIPYTDLANNKTSFKYYFGPNKLNLLQDVAPEFDENLNLGWSILTFVNKYLILQIWRGLESAFSSYPLIIIIMVIIIRLILSPLTYKSHISMAKMRVLKPELDELKEKHGEDMQKMQQEQMALYRKVGINPLSGCIPMLLQFPILVALFYYIPNAIELRQVSFLWAEDLSTYDSIWNFGFEVPFYGDHMSLFTLLMTGSTLLYTWSNSQMTTVQGPMKTMQYVMPVMFLFFFNNYASGLTYYYFISNLVSFGQIYLFRKIINEDKIKKVLDENRKKNANKKKSKFQLRLEEAMKASEEQRKKGKKKK